jgi:hypothetical protein
MSKNTNIANIDCRILPENRKELCYQSVVYNQLATWTISQHVTGIIQSSTSLETSMNTLQSMLWFGSNEPCQPTALQLISQMS